MDVAFCCCIFLVSLFLIARLKFQKDSCLISDDYCHGAGHLPDELSLSALPLLENMKRDKEGTLMTQYNIAMRIFLLPVSWASTLYFSSISKHICIYIFLNWFQKGLERLRFYDSRFWFLYCSNSSPNTCFSESRLFWKSFASGSKCALIKPQSLRAQSPKRLSSLLTLSASLEGSQEQTSGSKACKKDPENSLEATVLMVMDHSESEYRWISSKGQTYTGECFREFQTGKPRPSLERTYYPLHWQEKVYVGHHCPSYLRFGVQSFYWDFIPYHQTQSPHPKLHGWSSWLGQPTLRSDVATYPSEKRHFYQVWHRLPLRTQRQRKRLTGQGQVFSYTNNLPVLTDHANPSLFHLLCSSLGNSFHTKMMGNFKMRSKLYPAINTPDNIRASQQDDDLHIIVKSENHGITAWKIHTISK